MTHRIPDAAILAHVATGARNVEIAAALGVSVRSLIRWRAARPELDAAIRTERARQAAVRPRPHGLRSTYMHGCRCDECVEANRTAMRAYRQQHPRRRASNA